ncbi:putative uncharacterized protein [Peptostreptococcus anaerobius CAG:621]|uniref:DUF2273 domain-containing protein n=1 Tax=Peptostreptococcus anaerobius TaxID=1261 RepID=UPI00033929BF|nr:DUF2273 domain-containing protein [Peptostreptococcus anaerobius]CCY49592.1 putative uncharacterized protein [Peptostreptococcus anaerobius CAG:621]
MADEKYHIEDFDDVDIVISEGSKSAKKDEADKLVKAQPKIIYESSDDYSVYDEDVYDDYYKDIYDDIYEEAKSKKSKQKKSKKIYVEEKDPFKRPDSQWDRMVKEIGDYIVRTSYRKPNTFKATLVGLLIGIMILILGFAKALLISLIVFVANIIGQLLDDNPRVWNVLDFLIRKFK